MANEGVIPFETARDEVRAPYHRIVPAPEDEVPTEKYVSVSVPPVAWGKLMAAALLAVQGAFPETVHPPEERATA